MCDKELSDFEAGFEPDKVTGIQKVEKELYLWIADQNDTEIYTRGEEKYSNGSFELEGNHRPNLFIHSKNKNYIINVVSAENSSDVHNGAVKTIEYWDSIIKNDKKVNLRRKSFTIDAVLLATEHSRLGHLFNNQNKNDPLRDQRSDEGQETAQYNKIPKIEHTCSETLIRLLWRFGKEKNPDAKIGLGGLLSSQLDTEEPAVTDAEDQDPMPAALSKASGSDSNQDWNYIPDYIQQY